MGKNATFFDKNTLLSPDKPHEKFLICIENAKIEKIKTYFSLKIVSKENYVLQNAKYVGRGEIKNFP